MKLVYRHLITGRVIRRRFQSWPDLLNSAWWQYRIRRPIHLLNTAAEVGWQALDEVLP